MAGTKSSPKSATSKAKSQSDHPKYMDMIREAIIELKDRTGSSRQAIKKYILAKYTLIESVAVKQINLALKRGLEQKIIYCPQGHSNSYKLFKQEKPKAKKPAAKKVAEKKKTTTTKKTKSTTAKKATTKKAPAKKAATTKKATTKKATTKAAATKKTVKKRATSAAKKSKTTKSKK